MRINLDWLRRNDEGVRVPVIAVEEHLLHGCPNRSCPSPGEFSRFFRDMDGSESELWICEGCGHHFVTLKHGTVCRTIMVREDGTWRHPELEAHPCPERVVFAQSSKMTH
ncbi:MAG TPA: hypothetical protein VJL32_02005 [Candidatus Paceibacterota bacterium]